MTRELSALRNRLRTLVLVMGELEVDPPAVQIEPVPEQIERHHYALRVPSRPPRAPRRVPRRLVRLGLLPKGEVEGRALRIVNLDPGPGAKRLQGLPCK